MLTNSILVEYISYV